MIELDKQRWIPKLSRQELERRRLAAGEDLKAGMKQADIALKYNVHPSSVSRWNNEFQKHGKEGLRRKKAPGAKSKLSKEQQETLRGIIFQGATTYEYKTDLWTLRRVAAVIKKEFGVTYHFRSLWDVLHRMGLSCQKPARQAAERKEAERINWLKNQWVTDRKN